MAIPVLTDIGKIGRVVVSHFIFYRVLLLHWDMTWNIFDSEMEAVFIEIDKSIFITGSNIVIRVIYRMPNSSVDVFNDRISDILNVIQKEHKLCYFLGDLNIDFLKADDHRATGELLDVLYCYNVFPLIPKPTRITSTTATLIDHILTNNLDDNMMHIQGILCTSISDHYAVFHVASNAKTDHAQAEMPLFKRNWEKGTFQIYFWNEPGWMAICVKWNRHPIGL